MCFINVSVTREFYTNRAGVEDMLVFENEDTEKIQQLDVF